MRTGVDVDVDITIRYDKTIKELLDVNVSDGISWIGVRLFMRAYDTEI